MLPHIHNKQFIYYIQVILKKSCISETILYWSLGMGLLVFELFFEIIVNQLFSKITHSSYMVLDVAHITSISFKAY